MVMKVLRGIDLVRRPRRRLTVQIVLPVAVVSLLLLSVGVGGAWYVHSLQRRSSELLSQEVAGIRAAEELIVSLTDTRHVLNRYLIGGAQDLSELDEVAEPNAHTRHWLAQAEALANSPEELAQLGLMRRNFEAFCTGLEAARRIADPAERERTIQHLSLDVLNRDVMQPTREFLDYNEKSASETAEKNRALASRLSLALLVIGICGAAAGMVMGFGLARGIYQAMIQLTLPLRAVAGQLTEGDDAITVSGDLEFEDLEHVLQVLSDRVDVLVHQLSQARGEALRAEQLAAVGQLAAGLAHELRNPLMSMKLLVQSAVADGDEPQLSSRDLSILEDEIGRLEQLVQTFLDFARPPVPQPQPLDLGEVAASVAEFVSRRADRQQIRIAMRRGHSPNRIEADPGQLRQLVLNLLLNALDAVPPGGRIEVTVEETRAGDAAPCVRLRVRDTGRGLPEHLRDRVFDPFITTKPNGIGLGLSICRRIAQAHGGSIAVRDAAGGGAEFVVELPILRKTADGMAPCARPVAVPA